MASIALVSSYVPFWWRKWIGVSKQQLLLLPKPDHQESTRVII
uniref:Macaca fascicularis brain cDNA clone: QflA-19062, similar to human RNA guanylyltransferase and 5'-phosphatase (RNGTT), mRNA, RefSeq: NM_003800.1 n=1 Tax=Macaca fascicularis TaxID=9541 RepID=I7GLP7_MACFA|nr:unnamed protein product [Macaca fascicularis]